MRTIAVANQKGGCGKTTTAVNVATAFAAVGNRVLLVDLDPQAHSTLGLGHNPEAFTGTVYEALTLVAVPLSKVIIPTAVAGLDLVPSNILLSGVEFDLVTFFGREHILDRQLAGIDNNFDICIIDCSPSLSLLTVNALVAADEVLIPVQTHYYAIEGLKQLLGTINIVKERFNPDLKILGVLLTFVEDSTNLSRQIQQQMRECFQGLVFNTVIHNSVRLAEAPSAGESVLTYAPKSISAAEYKALAEEIKYVRT